MTIFRKKPFHCRKWRFLCSMKQTGCSIWDLSRKLIVSFLMFLAHVRLFFFRQRCRRKLFVLQQKRCICRCVLKLLLREQRRRKWNRKSLLSDNRTNKCCFWNFSRNTWDKFSSFRARSTVPKKSHAH